MALKVFKANDNKVVSNAGSKINKMVINLFRNLMYMLYIKAIKELIFLTFNAKKTFNHL